MAAAAIYDFSGKHAVITGGAAGIGEACARRLLAGGAKVSIWDRDAQALAAVRDKFGAQAQGVQVDVSDEQSVIAAVKSTLSFSPQIDILVNSAGITGPNTTVIEYPVEEWNRVFDINVRGTFLTCKNIAPVMKLASGGKGYGRIVNIASVAGKEGNPNASAYSASKAAVIGLTKSLGKELALTEIKVNCITPAAVKTGMFDQMTQQHIDFMLSKIPMNRFGEVTEIANLVAWLSSDECSFSTGAVFDISGGRATY
ncbi:MAG: SDR family NAD(P)-dependent oxidoreductase [Sheuella sp.]|nr:SDR family NAD(P)-dependent oxidoreductase [Sheuella sp.]